MQDFFVLGIIPGTNIQVSFETYAAIVGFAFLITGVAVHIARSRQQSAELFSASDFYIETPVCSEFDMAQSEIIIIKPDQMAEGFDRTIAAPQVSTAAPA